VANNELMSCLNAMKRVPPSELCADVDFCCVKDVVELDVGGLDVVELDVVELDIVELDIIGELFFPPNWASIVAERITIAMIKITKVDRFLAGLIMVFF
jgi:hypothetical protein